MSTRKRNISDSHASSPSGSRRKLDEDVEPNPQPSEHPTFATIERNDLNDKRLDEDLQIKKICDTLRRLIQKYNLQPDVMDDNVMDDNLDLLLPSLEHLIRSLAKQVGHDSDQAELVSRDLLAETFGERKALIQKLLADINEGFASVRRLGPVASIRLDYMLIAITR